MCISRAILDTSDNNTKNNRHFRIPSSVWKAIQGAVKPHVSQYVNQPNWLEFKHPPLSLMLGFGIPGMLLLWRLLENQVFELTLLLSSFDSILES